MTSHHNKSTLSGSSVSVNAYTEFNARDNMMTILPLKIVYKKGHTPAFQKMEDSEIDTFLELMKGSENFVEIPVYAE